MKGFSLALDSWIVNLSKTGRTRKQALSICVDWILVVICLWGAYTLRIGVPFSDFAAARHIFIFLPVITIVIMASLGIYRWKVRSSNRKLFYQLSKACLMSAIVVALLTFLLPPDRHNPRSIFLIYGLLLTCSTTAARFFWQSLFDAGNRGEPVAIYGAGQAGASLLQSLYQGEEFRPVLLLDDNPALAGTTVCGLEVIQPAQKNLEQVLFEHDVGRVILAMPSIDAADYESKVELLSRAGVYVQTIPTYAELMSGGANYGQVRDISITDILGRSEVPPNPELLGKCVKGRVVLVTGAGGSIGSELCRQIITQQPSKLVALDHSEENLYKLTEELLGLVASRDMLADAYVPVLGSVNDTSVIDDLMRSYAVKTVYHAAAYKHVPIIQEQPEQGVRVNILGTKCVLESAIKHRIENFVLISTDKAVRPANSMGASKRIAELILQAKARSQTDTRISMVRFGNVLGSSGSVVPKFKKQIDAGGPITLTDPNITRFFMTIPEAAQLVLQASAIARGGDVFVLDMGEPVRIEDLAVSMVHLSGKRLKRDTGDKNDIEIVIEGLRPGEKMYEELFITNAHGATKIQKVFTADEAWMSWSDLSKKLDVLASLNKPADRSLLRSKLLALAFYGQADKPDVIPALKVVQSRQQPAPEPAVNVELPDAAESATPV